MTFVWYVKFVPGEARKPKAEQDLRHLERLLSPHRWLWPTPGDAIWLMSDDTKEDSGSLEPVAAKDIFHPRPTPSFFLPSPPGPLAHLICCNYATKDAA